MVDIVEKKKLYDMNVSSIFQNTTENMNNIIDDILYISLPEGTSYSGYLFELMDIFTKDERLLYTGILLSFFAIVIMIMDFFNF